MSSVPSCRALLAACILAGCSAQDGQTTAAKVPVPAPSVTGKSACFYAREAQDFRVLDRSNVIVYAPNDANAYHLRISPPSTALRDAETLAFLPAGGRICGHAGERLIIGPSGSDGRLAIIDVARLSPGSLQMLRGGSDGGALPAPRTQPGPGADIEGEATPPAPARADSEGET
jgi:hypothetical protein